VVIESEHLVVETGEIGLLVIAWDSEGDSMSWSKEVCAHLPCLSCILRAGGGPPRVEISVCKQQ